MIVFVMLVCILGLSFGIKIKLKISEEESIFLAVFGIVLFAYALGLVNLLGLSIYIIAFLSIVSFIYTILKVIKKEVKFSELITLPFWFYVVGIIFIYYIVKDIQIGYYDEYMFWGTNLKEMLNRSCLWANSQIDGIHLVYPPFTAIAEYIFCKFNGKYDDGVVYFAITSLMFTSLMPLLKNEKYNFKSLFKILATIVVTYLAIVIYVFNPANLSVDCILGIVFAVAMFLAYDLKDKKDYMVLTVLLVSITLIKTNGILLAGIVIMQIFLREAFLLFVSSKEKRTWKNFINVGALLLTVILTFASWKLYYTVNGKAVDDRHDKNNVASIDISEFVNALTFSGKASERNKKIVKDFWDRIFDTKIIVKFDCYTTAWCFLIVNILFLIYWLVSKEKLKGLANFISINIGFILYLMTNLLMYMFVFQHYQGEVLMGFVRYMRSYMLGMTLNFVYFALKNITLKNGIIFLIIVWRMANGLNRLMIDPRLGLKSEIDFKTQMNSKNIIENTDEDSKIYIIDQKNDFGVEFMITRYLISPRKTNLLYEWNIGNSDNGIYYRTEITESELMEKLISEEYDYVYIISIDNTFLDEFSNIISGEALAKLEDLFVEDDKYVMREGMLLKVNREEKIIY